MSIEYEAKILDIDPAGTERLIVERGGRKLGEKLMRRHVYDIVPGDMSKWIRLRDGGDGATLTVKEITSDAVDGTHQIEVRVDDFAATHDLLQALGFTAKSYQENRRTSFVLDGAALKIEAESAAEASRVAGLLGYTDIDLTSENTIKIYARHGIDLTSIPELRFEDPVDQPMSTPKSRARPARPSS